MTVTYTASVASSSFGCFLRLLVRWRGSVYKLVWKEFVIFVTSYYTLSFIYRFALKEDQKRIFEKVSAYCEMYNNLIPIAFVLGFFVSIVVSRWWAEFCTIPWPDRMALFVTAHIQGLDDRGRVMRRTIMRYLCLAYVITMSSISPVVKKRFPSWAHMTEAGFMTQNEETIIDTLQTPFNKFFVPLAWVTSLISRARRENRIKDDFAVKTLIDEVNQYRGQLGTLFNYDWISIPLVYTQVVTLAVYTFFLSCLMGRQFLDNGPSFDMYVPIFTFLQFFFYMGWLKVAESLVNPFGEDDDDFDINAVIDRNLQVSYLVVDGMHQEHPELIKDQYWDTVQFDLPYTAATANERGNEMPLGSAMNIGVSPKNAEFLPLNSIMEENELNDVTTGVDVPGSEFRPRMARSSSKITKGFRPSLIRRTGSKHSNKTANSVNANVLRAQESVISSNNTMVTDSKQEDIFHMSDLGSQITDAHSNVDKVSQHSTNLDKYASLPSVQESDHENDDADDDDSAVRTMKEKLVKCGGSTASSDTVKSSSSSPIRGRMTKAQSLDESTPRAGEGSSPRDTSLSASLVKVDAGPGSSLPEAGESPGRNKRRGSDGESSPLIK